MAPSTTLHSSLRYLAYADFMENSRRRSSPAYFIPLLSWRGMNCHCHILTMSIAHSKSGCNCILFPPSFVQMARLPLLIALLLDSSDDCDTKKQISTKRITRCSTCKYEARSTLVPVYLSPQKSFHRWSRSFDFPSCKVAPMLNSQRKTRKPVHSKPTPMQKEQ